jgi:ribosomal protein S18 acetylase RimI-like enzyme
MLSRPGKRTVVPANSGSSNAEILDFEPALAPAFRALNTEWLERWFAVEPIDARVLGDPQGEIIDHGGAILFARVGELIVGTVALKHHGGGVFELTKMAVTARFQGAGIGRRLLEAALGRFQARAGKRLFLESHSSLAPALRLYESQGFRHAPRPGPSDYQRSDIYMVYDPAPGRPSDAAGR